MSSFEYMKKECFSPGTLSSASLKRTFTKIQNKRNKKRKVVPKAHEEVDTECDFCRCPLLGSNRTVRRILTASLLSFLALLGSVSNDLNHNFDVLHATEAAYDQLTSCRTKSILQLVGKLQAMRHLWSKEMGNQTFDEDCFSDIIVPMFTSLCNDLAAQFSSQGLSCSDELVVFCEKVLEGLVNDTMKRDCMTENDTKYFSVAIFQLLDIWGSVEENIMKVKQYSVWRDVLSLQLLVIFIELNLQLRDFPSIATQTRFQYRWAYILNHLGFAKVLAERLHNCWLENIDLKVNLSHHISGGYQSALWELSAVGAEALPGSQVGIQALKDTQECLLAQAIPAIKLSSRAVFSGFSMRICLLAMACLIYPVVMVSFKQMTEWIQNYAHSLKEKTEDLKRQRRLAEDLLHQMLPKSVAKQLRHQKHVEAESYEKVTIFFSDIVGFTSISASCAPLQVVEMLNNLYMCFDTRIESYDVYKVETIGDAYMVVSGLPERNGDRHADEIAKMSLDLVAAVRQVAVPHMPDHRLQLRAGIHTGPCVAGIVGYKMPRYCLFGDTVNTASRMESTSLPQKIHASSETYLALITDNAYEFELRGEIEVKGKGKMSTYWLIGHKNYSVQNDSLVCHWNPGMVRTKKTVAGSQGKTEGPGLCVSAQVEPVAGSYGTLGSMVGGLQGGGENSSTPGKGQTCSGEKPDLLPGSINM